MLILILVIYLLSSFYWSIQVNAQPDDHSVYNLEAFFVDIFPELFGMLFSILFIGVIWLFMRKSERIAEYIYGTFGESHAGSRRWMFRQSIDDVVLKLDKIVKTIKIDSESNSSITKLKEHSDYWHQWREELTREDHVYAGALSGAWKELVEAHLDLENEYLKSKKIKNTSESFTTLISRISNSLYEEYISGKANSQLKRYHVTGMLPEEFFNGPQIEYTSLSSTPIIFCHAFEHKKYSDSHYKFIKEKKKYVNMDIKRCIIVRKDARYVESRYSALSRLEELKNQKDLVIRKADSPLPMVSLFDSSNPIALEVSERLLLHCKHRVKEHFRNKKRQNLAFIQKIINCQQFQYFSICNKNHLEESQFADKASYVPLFEYFSTYFSKNYDDTYYYAVEEEYSGSLQKFLKPGFMPEIVLFGLDLNNDGVENKWLLGLLGQYQPFTREMEIEILKPFDATLCAKEIIGKMFTSKLMEL